VNDLKEVGGMPIDEDVSVEKLKKQKKQIKQYMKAGRISEKEGKHLVKLINQHPAMQ